MHLNRKFFKPEILCIPAKGLAIGMLVKGDVLNR